jgi:hypothetical protein
MRAFIPALLVLAMLAAPTPSPAAVSVGISVGIAPPVLPIYEQPPIPGPGYIWTPGYWAWGPDYYWVPGTWVYPPTIGFLWTPPWWGWSNGFYVFNAGYWGPHIGFYGGINYGFGYFGSGYDGGYWDHGRFFYNREVTNIRNVNITNVYSKTVTNTGPAGASRVAFNGGNGGVNAQPTTQEQAALRERHIGPTALQTQHFNAARGNPDLRASTTNGQPKILATERAGRFTNTGAVTSGPGATGRNVQSNIRTTNTGPTGPKGVTGGPTGTHRTLQTNKGPTGPTGLQGGKGPGGAPHVMSQPVHPAIHGPQGHPPPPGGKNPNQKTPG